MMPDLPPNDSPSASTSDLPVVLVVDDEVRSLDAIRRTLDEDFEVLTASDTRQARACLQSQRIDVILCDQRMPDTDGVRFLKEIREQWPDCVRMIISGYTDSQDIIAGINDAGIYQYILKPWSPDYLLNAVRQAVQAQTLQRQTHQLSLELRASSGAMRQKLATQLAQARNAFGFERIVRAPGSPIDAVCNTALRIARYDISALILGESGTGKELIARAIHYASPRLGGPFVMENCAALTDTLLESELFGHKRGAFTGAYEDHQGLFQRAHNGTLFLDEIGETSPAFQVKLLRVLQEGEIRPVGSTRSVAVDVRVLAATHRNLQERVAQGLFREDLYYRLAGISLSLPALRERVGDIALLARSLLTEVTSELGHPPVTLSDSAIACLAAYDWPGNIRELRNELARAVALGDGNTLQPDGFSAHVLRGGASSGARPLFEACELPHQGTLAERLDVVEAMLIREALLRHHGNKSHTAKALGLSRVGLRAKMQRFGL